MPVKNTLDFFPLETVDDDKIEMIKAEHQLEGYAIIVEIWKRAYRENGYYYPWTRRQVKLFCRRENVDCDVCEKVVETAIEEGLFDRGIYNTFRVLTSRGMQKRYFHVCFERRSPEVITDLLLMSPPPLKKPEYQYVFVDNPYVEITLTCMKNDTPRDYEPKSRDYEPKSREDPGGVPGGNGVNPGNSTHSIVQYSTVEDSIGQDTRLDNDSSPDGDHTEPPSLYDVIKDSFEGIYGQFENYGREGKGINGLISKATKRVENDQGFADDDAVREFIGKVIWTFLNLTRTGDDYWQGQPYLPSVLNSSGIYPRVITQMDKEIRKGKIQQKYTEVFTDFSFTHAKGET